jgi:LuxR family transcriptional regulator, maltose regulon positive regulatory protein
VSVLRLSWLGHPTIELDGAPVRLEMRKNAALLAYVSLSERPVSRERLAAIFWPDFGPNRARANLRRSLASLHASLPGEWLAAERDSIGVRHDERVWIDVGRVLGLVSEVKEHGHDVDHPCGGCLAGLDEAARLFQGDFLEGFTLPGCPEFDDWQLARREGLRAELSWILERLARAHAAGRSWESALSAARRWLALDRLHEPAHALVIRLLALSGQRSGAIRQYEQLAALLEDELGQKPDESTRALHEGILSRTSAEAPAAQDRPRVARPEGSRGRLPGLLRTKLSVPPARPDRVRRERLAELIERTSSCGLAVVSAPAGFGKSTMLSDWASRAGVPVAWISLDAGDNDVQRFLAYVTGACSEAVEGVGEDAERMLQAMPHAPPESIATALINAIESRGEELALVLEDYQFIRSPEVHATLRFLVDHRPSTLRIVIATREDPPLPMARLRTQGKLAEARAEDLRFTLSEARQFLTRAMSLVLTDDQVEALDERTEGWIAGLQIAALSLRGRDDVDQFLASFGGTHRHVLDYLTEEVFSRQSAEHRQFLLETSFLGRLSAGLCEAVTGLTGAQEILEHLERANLFLVPLDERRRWYRYHHLFADLLRHRLERERSSEDLAGLHVKAGDWFAANGESAEAIEEYIAGAAYGRAAEIIEWSFRRFFPRAGLADVAHRKDFLQVLTSVGLAQLLHWCSQVPRDVFEAMPGFCVAAGWTLMLAGRGEEAGEFLDAAERGSSARTHGDESAEMARLRREIAVGRALAAVIAGETTRPVELARAAGELISTTDHLSVLIPFVVGGAFRNGAELEKAEAAYAECLRAGLAVGDIWSYSGAVYETVQIYRLQGRLGNALALLDDFERHAEPHRAAAAGSLAAMSVLKGELVRESGRLEEALSLVEKAVQEVDRWSLPSDVYVGHQILARVLRSCGDLKRAGEELEKVRDLPRRALVFPSLYAAFEADRVGTWLAAGDIASAEAWARDHQAGKPDLVVNREIERVCRVRIRLARATSREEHEENAALLDELARSARAGGRIGPLIEILTLQARAAMARSSDEEAMRAITEAVELAQPAGYFRSIVEEGPQIAELLRRGLASDGWKESPLREYVRRLVAAA